LSHSYTQFLISIKKHMKMLPIVGGACAIALVANYAVVKLNLGIMGIAAATVFAIFVRFSGVYFMASRYLYSASEAWRNYLVFCVIFVLMTGVMVALQGMDNFPISETGIVGLQMLVFTLLMSPILYRLNQEFGIWSIVRPPIQESADEVL